MRCSREHHCARQDVRRALLFAVLILLLGGMGGGLNAQSSSNSFFRTKHGASDQFFINSAIPHLKIEIKGTNLVALRRNNRAYVRSTIREGDTVYSDVGIHVKGAAGSSRDLDDKPALTLHFNKFRDGQRFHGLDKIHLNNSVQDPSYLTELLCGELFRAADRKSTRLNSSHTVISYAVFCLKKKKKQTDNTVTNNIQNQT